VTECEWPNGHKNTANTVVVVVVSFIIPERKFVLDYMIAAYT